MMMLLSDNNDNVNDYICRLMMVTTVTMIVLIKITVTMTSDDNDDDNSMYRNSKLKGHLMLTSL